MALKYFGRVRADRKADQSFVTAADREVEKLVREHLSRLTPGYGVLGEEDGFSESTGRDMPFWVVDPLDGTSAFVSGLPCWAFSLGLVSAGRAVFGLVYLPVTDELFHTGPQGEVFLNGAPCQPESPAALDGESVLYVPSDMHRRFRITFPGKLRSLGSAAYHGILTRRAGTAGVLQGRIYLWDAAAILALNSAWGMRVGTLEGEPVSLSMWEGGKASEQPLLFARPGNFERVAGTIQRL